MSNINEDVERLLIRLGERLKAARLGRNESQETFAQRIGITRQSYGKMEKGASQTPIGNWLAASCFLNRLESWETVLDEPEDLFQQFETNRKKRQRAGRKRKSGK